MALPVSVLTFSTPADLYLRFPYLHFQSPRSNSSERTLTSYSGGCNSETSDRHSTVIKQFKLSVLRQVACTAKKIRNKLWCESTTNSAPVLRIAASRGFSELTKKCNQVVPWSLHTFTANFMQIGPAVFS